MIIHDSIRRCDSCLHQHRHWYSSQRYLRCRMLAWVNKLGQQGGKALVTQLPLIDETSCVKYITFL